MRALAISLLAILPGSSLAQETGTSAPVASTAHRHLGFFFRADVGVGYVTSPNKNSEGPPPISGVSVPLGLAVGGAVAENWILAGEVWGGFTPKTVDGVSQTLFVYGYSLAVVHYFMPANVYLSLAPGVARITIERGNLSVSSNYGPGLKFAVGKEWWVGDHWGLGIAAELILAVNGGDGFSTVTTVGSGLTFSATFN